MKCDFCEEKATVEIQMRKIVRIRGLSIRSPWEPTVAHACSDCSPKLGIAKKPEICTCAEDGTPVDGGNIYMVCTCPAEEGPHYHVAVSNYCQKGRDEGVA